MKIINDHKILNHLSPDSLWDSLRGGADGIPGPVRGCARSIPRATEALRAQLTQERALADGMQHAVSTVEKTEVDRKARASLLPRHGAMFIASSPIFTSVMAGGKPNQRGIFYSFVLISTTFFLA